MLTRSDLDKIPSNAAKELPEYHTGGYHVIKEGIYSAEVIEKLWKVLYDFKYSSEYTLNITEFFGIKDLNGCFAKISTSHFIYSGVNSNIISFGILSGINIFYYKMYLWKKGGQLLLDVTYSNKEDYTSCIQMNMFINTQLTELVNFGDKKRVSYPNKLGFTLTVPPEMLYDEDELLEEREQIDDVFKVLHSQLSHPYLETKEVGINELYKYLVKGKHKFKKMPKIPEEISDIIFECFVNSTTIIESIRFSKIILVMLEIDNTVLPSDNIPILQKIIKCNYDENVMKMLKYITSNYGFIERLSRNSEMHHPLFRTLGFRYNELDMTIKVCESTINTRCILWNMETGSERLKRDNPSDEAYARYSKVLSSDGKIQIPGDFVIRRSSKDGTEYDYRTGRINRCLAIDYLKGDHKGKMLLRWNWANNTWNKWGFTSSYNPTAYQTYCCDTIDDYIKANKDFLINNKS